MEDDCCKRCDVENSGGVSVAEHTCNILSHRIGSFKKEVDSPLYVDSETIFRLQGPQEVYPKTTWFNSNTMYTEAAQDTMESPGLRAPANYSPVSATPARSSALQSLCSTQLPQYSIGTPELQTSSNYCFESCPSAVLSSSMGSPHLIHGHTVSVPEWAPQGLGLNPSIVSYDNCGPGNEYTFSVDDFEPDYNPPKPNGFVGKYKTISISASTLHALISSK